MNALRLLLVLFLVPAAVQAGAASGKGTTTAGFLKLGAGARAAGMGEAYCSVVDDADALYWNPAALVRVAARSATFMHASYMDSSFFDYAGFAHNLGRFGAWGIGTQYFSAGSMTETDDTGTDVGKFSPHDLSVALGYAYTFRNLEFFSDMDEASLGISGKYIQSSILATARTWAVDLGMLSKPYLDDKLRYAVTLVNLGGKMKFEQAKESLPLAFRLGATYKLWTRWTSSLDIGLPRDNAAYVAAGTEYMMKVGSSARVAGRMGFNSRSFGDIDGFNGVSFGIGFGFDKLGFDYGFVPFGSVGQAHRISVSLAF